jgi:hypothetical protein
LSDLRSAYEVTLEGEADLPSDDSGVEESDDSGVEETDDSSVEEMDEEN